MPRTWQTDKDGRQGWSKPLSDAAGRLVEMPLAEYEAFVPKTVGEAIVLKIAETALSCADPDTAIRAFEKLADRTDGKPGMEKLGMPMLVPVLVSMEQISESDWNSKYLKGRPREIEGTVLDAETLEK